MWISVHDTIIGGKLRTLAKDIGCSQNEAIGMLIRLWLWGINNADADGRIMGADEGDISDTLAIGLAKDIDPMEATEALIRTGWIDSIGNELYIHDWSEWQGKWNKLQEIKKQNADRQRRFRERIKERAVKETDKPDGSKSENQTEKQQKSSGYTPSFEEFWKAYPRKVGKGEAYKKYRARLNDGYREEELLEAAVNYAARCAADRTEDKYIKHAKTFLSDTLPFTDYLKARRQSQNEPQTNDDENPFRKYLQEQGE